MSVERSTNQKPIENKLRKLIDCVIKKARSDEKFAAELAKVFSVHDSESESVESEKQSVFELVNFLHANGEQKLRRELELKTDSDLRSLYRAEGLARSKEVKTIERETLISELIKYAIQKLNQGSAFLGNS